MATPHVVGAAALLFSACPSATPLDVMRAVMAGAVRDRVLKTDGVRRSPSRSRPATAGWTSAARSTGSSALTAPAEAVPSGAPCAPPPASPSSQLLASAAVAEAALYDVDKVLGDDIERVAPRTDVPIRLPEQDAARLRPGRVRRTAARTTTGYEFEIAATRQCGANVCFLAQFSGRGGREPGLPQDGLPREGDHRLLQAADAAAASCSPPMIQWVQGGVLYSIQAKLGVSGRKKQRRAMKRAANQSIRSTPLESQRRARPNARPVDADAEIPASGVARPS